MNIFRGADLVDTGEKAVVLFTRGKNLRLNPDGSGQTGNWKIKQEEISQVTKIILYLRNYNFGQNWVFTGRIDKITPTKEPGRLIFDLSDLRKVGSTNSDWLTFGNGERNPIFVTK